MTFDPPCAPAPAGHAVNPKSDHDAASSAAASLPEY